jgi:hypothetical protein
VLARGGGVRLGGQQPGIDVRGLAAAAKPGAVWCFALAEQQVVRAALYYLAVLEAECLRGRAPPAAGRFSPALAGLEVIASSVLGQVGSTWRQM